MFQRLAGQPVVQHRAAGSVPELAGPRQDLLHVVVT